MYFSSILLFHLLALFTFHSISSTLAATETKSYSYNPDLPNGPSDWHTINPTFATCAPGQSQSPIDIPNNTLDGSTATSPTVNRRSGSYTVKNSTVNFALECSSSNCGSLSVDDSDYSLINIHFHIPSEHTRQGKRYPLEVHLVHQNTQGQLAVVSVLFDYGLRNLGVDTVLNNLQSSSFSLNTNLFQALPSRYCRYSGSLTTPPCSEQVKWILTQKVATVTRGQVQTYINNIGVDGYGETYGNNRPVLPRNGRQVTCYPLISIGLSL